jgi:hypothetical protein
MPTQKLGMIPVTRCLKLKPKVLAQAVIEIMFRGKWVSIFEVKTVTPGKNWDMDFSEPVHKIRVRYL